MPETMKTDLQSFSELARKYALAALGGNRQAHDRFPHGGGLFQDALDQARGLGFFSVTLPAECGGNGLGVDALCAILDEISRVDASMAGIIFTHTLAQEIILAAGRRDLPGTVDGLIAFPSFCNPAEIEKLPAAVKSGSSYALSGTLEYLALGSLAAGAIVPAKIGGQDGYSLFQVDLERNGITRSAPVQSLGLHACPAVDITLDAVHADIVGDEGGGTRYFETACERLFAAAAAISAGIMKGAMQEALEYSADRIQGGRAIFNWSALRMILAEMAVKVEIAGMAVAQACRAVTEGWPGAGITSRAAALHVQELATGLTTDGIQVLGGYGYMKDFGQEKRYRDAKQAQALLGMVPMKKLAFIKRLTGE